MNTVNILESNRLNIFGAGITAQKVRSVIQSVGKIVSSFIISSGDERKIDEIRVTPLNQLSGIDLNIPIIIAIFNREPNAFLSDIIKQLKLYGFTKIITYPEFHSIYPKQLGDIFWLTDKNFYVENIDQYNDVLKLLGDKTSINCYSHIIEYLKTFNAEVLPKPDFDNQYFPKDIDVWDGKGAFYDLGSYDGNNIVDAFKEKGLIDIAVAFEPDLDNFQKIVNNKHLLKSVKQLLLYPCGVWSKTTLLRFNVGSGESSAQSEFGDHVIPVVSVDDVLRIQAGYIKFDVEGSEIEALYGAKGTIQKYRPSLAISIYHKPEHFYSIPKLVNEWNLGYKFYVRLHGNNLFDTVLYCIQ